MYTESEVSEIHDFFALLEHPPVRAALVMGLPAHDARQMEELLQFIETVSNDLTEDADERCFAALGLALKLVADRFEQVPNLAGYPKPSSETLQKCHQANMKPW